MDIEKLKENYPLLFEFFPLSLIEFALSKNMAEKIANICIENRIKKEEEIKKIASETTIALFNFSPKENIPSILKESLNIEDVIANKIYSSLDEIIFSKLDNLESEEEIETIKEKNILTPEVTKKINDNYREKIE
jgi:predicted transcriptional regulator